MNRFWMAPALPFLLLAGCMSEEQAAERATAQAREHCESEGKQFVVKDVKTVESDNVFAGKSLMVTGDCLGPGDPGYVPPGDKR